MLVSLQDLLFMNLIGTRYIAKTWSARYMKLKWTTGKGFFEAS